LPPPYDLFPYTTLFRSEGEGLLDGRWQSGLADSVPALITREQEVGRRLGMVRLRGDVAAARLDVLERDRAIGADERAGRALHVRSEEHTSELQSRGHLV